MRFISSLSIITIIAMLALVACNSAEQKTKVSGPVGASSPAAPAATSDGVRRVTPEELKAMLDKNEAVVIDVRTEATYNAAHVKGAKLIPETEILKRANELPRDKTIVTYCS